MSPKSIKAFETFRQAKDYSAFSVGVMARLAKGAEDYGDKSFSKAPEELVKELQAECLDLAGWGFILHSRLEAMRKAFEGAEQDRLAKERMAAPVKQAGPPQPPPAERWGVFSTNRYTGEVYRSIFFDGVYSSEAAARKAFAGCEDSGNRFAKRLEPKPAPEQWGVFYRSNRSGEFFRSVEISETFPSFQDARDAIADKEPKPRLGDWFAQRLTPVHK